MNTGNVYGVDRIAPEGFFCNMAGIMLRMADGIKSALSKMISITIPPILPMLRHVVYFTLTVNKLFCSNFVLVPCFVKKQLLQTQGKHGKW